MGSCIGGYGSADGSRNTDHEFHPGPTLTDASLCKSHISQGCSGTDGLWMLLGLPAFKIPREVKDHPFPDSVMDQQVGSFPNQEPRNIIFV